MPSPYQQTLKWFKTPEAYAAEIKRKEASGIQLTNPEAAASFKRDYAYLFGNNPSQAVAQAPRQQPASQSLFSSSVLSRTPEQMQAQAQRLAGLQVNPQRGQLQRSLEEAIANAEAQKRSIQAAYEGVPTELELAAEEARRKALESAIARGVGRSGVVDYQAAKIGAEQQRQLAQVEAEKAAKLAALADQLGLTKKQVQDQLQQLAAREGELAATYLPQEEERLANYQMQVLPYISPTMGQVLAYRGNIESGVGQVAPAWSPFVAASQQATPQQQLNAAVGKSINIDNERRYLESQIMLARQTGNRGLEQWARDQAAQYARQYPGFRLGV
jgi:hypothetical protein